jgi:hypothetical protein
MLCSSQVPNPLPEGEGAKIPTNSRFPIHYWLSNDKSNNARRNRQFGHLFWKYYPKITTSSRKVARARLPERRSTKQHEAFSCVFVDLFASLSEHNSQTDGQADSHQDVTYRSYSVVTMPSLTAPQPGCPAGDPGVGLLTRATTAAWFPSFRASVPLVPSVRE